ncbi:MAG: hypothetical protein EXR75_06485 [Myxococcales bacterium]|nr:hypothetical protein [Myxococcales bacterium]
MKLITKLSPTVGALALFALAVACPSTDAGDQICVPDENIFCRCPNGAPGTKLCAPDGSGFSACVVGFGEPCGDRPAGQGGNDPTGMGGSGSTTMSSSTGGPVGDKPLYEGCAADSQCQSGLCPMGFCTKPCTDTKECTFNVGECVDFQADGNAQCFPVCHSQADCSGFGCAGNLCSECGFGYAIDDWPIAVCADWGNKLAYPPEGSECTKDADCNLGHVGAERVCGKFSQVCVAGCYASSDCPAGTSCNGAGSLGECK